MMLGDRLKRMPGAPETDATIKGQFREGLADGVLRREVKRTLMEEPNIAFIKLRDLAIDLADDDVVSKRRRQIRKVNTYQTEVDSKFGSALETLSAALKSQTEILEAMKAKQEEVDIRLMKLEERPARNKPRSRPVDKSQIECRRCHMKGHYASDCLAPSPVPRSNQGN